MARTQAAEEVGMKWQPPGSLHAFVLARIARDVILDGYDTATRIPRLPDLERLCTRYLDLDDPVSRPGSPHGELSNYLVRVAYEQFTYQQNPHNELCRSWALFADTAATVDATTMTEDAWRDALGCGLDEFLRIAFVWHTAAVASRGWMDRAVLDHSGVLPLLGAMSGDRAWEVTTKRLSADIAHLRSDPGNAKVPKGLEKHRYNPLAARPYVRHGGRLLAPSPQLAVQRAWPNSIYYDRVKDAGFSDDLGAVFEAYVGRQLVLLQDAGLAEVLPKVTFDRGSGEEESVDHFVVFPDIVLLVEAKATRLTAEARLGTDRLTKDVARTLGVAYSQIEATVEMINSGRAEFAHLPTDRPALGLAVTLEPYWLMWGEGQLPPMPASIQVHPVNCADIEGLVSAALAGPINEVLIGLTEPRERVGREFNTAFSGVPAVGNPILDAAFERLLGVF
jgi:hypothetical protein